MFRKWATAIQSKQGEGVALPFSLPCCHSLAANSAFRVKWYIERGKQKVTERSGFQTLNSY